MGGGLIVYSRNRLEIFKKFVSTLKRNFSKKMLNWANLGLFPPRLLLVGLVVLLGFGQLPSRASGSPDYDYSTSLGDSDFPPLGLKLKVL